MIITASLSTCGPVAEKASVARGGGGGVSRETHTSVVCGKVRLQCLPYILITVCRGIIKRWEQANPQDWQVKKPAIPE